MNWLNPAAPVLDHSSESGVKQISITITYKERTVATRTTIRTINWTDPLSASGGGP